MKNVKENLDFLGFEQESDLRLKLTTIIELIEDQGGGIFPSPIE
jgi:hypothetical protein